MYVYHSACVATTVWNWFSASFIRVLGIELTSAGLCSKPPFQAEPSHALPSFLLLTS